MVSISTEAAALWPAPQALGPVNAIVRLPGSKSLTNRLLVLAALSDETSRIRRPLRARDTELMVAALRGLGTEIIDQGDDWVITPGPLNGPAQVDCGLAGNVMRFVPAISVLATGRIDFDGDPRARARPLAPLIQTLGTLGAELVDPNSGRLPFSVLGRGKLPGGPAGIDASESSQFISALLLAGCRYDHGLLLRSVGPGVPSLPHVDMTVAMLRQSGVAVERLSGPAWHVPAGTPRVGSVSVEPDLSNALPFFAAAMITGGRCVVPNWPTQSVQPLDIVASIVASFGGSLSTGTEGLAVQGGAQLTGSDLDMHEVGELVPTVTALASLAATPTVIRGVAHLRGHETDRLAALAEEFTALGGDVTQTEDGLRINPRRLGPGVFHTYDDHRLATTGAIVGLAVPGVLVENVATTGKTLPEFTSLWQHMLGNAAA